MRTENGLKLYNTVKRSDIVIYNRNAEAVALVECKAPEVKISQSTFDQIARYNIHFNASILMVTNGLTTYCVKIDKANGGYGFVNDIPEYSEICGYDS